MLMQGEHALAQPKSFGVVQANVDDRLIDEMSINICLSHLFAVD
jgi:hypothetical protein